MAEKSYRMSEVRGGSWEELPHAPTPDARGSDREDQPHVQGAVAARAQECLEELSVRKGSGEEMPLVQGKKQRLHFAGAAMKRYPTPKVRETQVRQEVLQEGIRGQTH